MKPFYSAKKKTVVFFSDYFSGTQIYPFVCVLGLILLLVNEDILQLNFDFFLKKSKISRFFPVIDELCHKFVDNKFKVNVINNINEMWFVLGSNM